MHIFANPVTYSSFFLKIKQMPIYLTLVYLVHKNSYATSIPHTYKEHLAYNTEIIAISYMGKKLLPGDHMTGLRYKNNKGSTSPRTEVI